MLIGMFAKNTPTTQTFIPFHMQIVITGADYYDLLIYKLLLLLRLNLNSLSSSKLDLQTVYRIPLSDFRTFPNSSCLQ